MTQENIIMSVSSKPFHLDKSHTMLGGATCRPGFVLTCGIPPCPVTIPGKTALAIPRKPLSRRVVRLAIGMEPDAPRLVPIGY
jgi:hypothetical protein